MRRKYKEFLSLLDKRNKSKGDKKKIDNLIRTKFGKELAVMITDSSGFSKRTQKYGIIQYLAVLKQVYDKLRIIFKSHSGKVIKEWADDFIVVFKDPLDAIKCGIEINLFLRKRNTGLKVEEKFIICVGIGYGNILFVEQDLFGNEVNIASKLGEDIAEGEEILVTENAYKFLKNNSKYKFRKFSNFKISGIKITYYKVLYGTTLIS
jgi:class 3 adenylate cyclase